LILHVQFKVQKKRIEEKLINFFATERLILNLAKHIMPHISAIVLALVSASLPILISWRILVLDKQQSKSW
jgi:hypothetical protein